MHAELKASILRGYLKWLAGAGLLEEIRAEVSPELAALMAEPPPATVWLAAAETTLPLVDAIARRRDLATVRRMSREAASGPILALLRPLVEGVLRIAMGPEGVVKRLPLVLGASARGITFEVKDLGESEAILVMRTTGLRETRASAEAWAGGVEALLQLARAGPTVEVIAIEGSAAISEVRTRIGWAARN